MRSTDVADSVDAARTRKTDPVTTRSSGLEFVVIEPPRRATVRSWLSVTRLLVAIVGVATLSSMLGGWANVSARSAQATLYGRLPHSLATAIVGSLQVLLFGVAVVWLVLIVGRGAIVRILRAAVAVIVATAALLILSRVVGRSVLPTFPHGSHRLATFPGRGPGLFGLPTVFPSNLNLVIVWAVLFVDYPWWGPRLHRVPIVIIVIGVVTRSGSVFANPVATAVVLGLAYGSAQLVALAFGVTNQRPSGAEVGVAIRRHGHLPTRVERLSERPGAAVFVVERADSSRLLVKVISQETWTSLLPNRIYRWLRSREAGDAHPFQALRSRVEHEALCALKAHADGVPTPRVIIVGELSPRSMLIAFERHDGEPLSGIPPERRPTTILPNVWQIVERLQSSGLVHHRLNAESLLVDASGGVVVVDFSGAEIGALSEPLSGDVAEVLAATAARLGVSRAVNAAIDALGPDAVAAALPRLQPLALTRATRALVKTGDCLGELRAEIRNATGVQHVPLQKLDRLRPRTLATLAMTGVALWTLVPSLLGAGSVWKQLANARFGWMIVVLGFSAMTYFGAALAFNGSVPDTLPFGPNLAAQVAASFIGIAAPGGRLALDIRFLHKRGSTPGAATAAVAVNSVGGFVVHGILTVVFVGLAGVSGLRTFHIPSGRAFAIMLVTMLGVTLIAGLVPGVRRIAQQRAFPSIRRSMQGISDVARQPNKLIALFAGSTMVTVGYVLALEASVLAFDSSPPFTSVALVFLLASAVTSIAPTPGGVGAVEAALTAGLTSAGMPSATALAAVMLFRIATFWLPILPGWIVFTKLQLSGNL